MVNLINSGVVRNTFLPLDVLAARSAVPVLAGTFADAVGTFNLMESQLSADRFRQQEFSLALASLNSFANSEHFYLPALRVKETSKPTQRHFAFFRDVQFPIAARAIALRCDNTLRELVDKAELPQGAERALGALTAKKIDAALLQSAVTSGLVQMASAEAFCGLVSGVSDSLHNFPPESPEEPGYWMKAMARFAAYGAAVYAGVHYQISPWFVFSAIIPMFYEAVKYDDFVFQYSLYYRRLNEIKAVQENAGNLALSMRDILDTLKQQADYNLPEEKFVRRVRLSADRPEFRRALLNGAKGGSLVLLGSGDTIRPSAKEGSYAVVKLPNDTAEIRLAVGKKAVPPDTLEGEQTVASGKFKIIAREGFSKLFLLSPETGDADVSLFKRQLKEYRVVVPKREGVVEQ